MDLYINPQGHIRAIYGETLSMQCLGAVRIQRASHVEPDDNGNWWADMEPSGGPVLGPFLFRSVALDAEQDWLTRHVLAPSQEHLPEGTSPLHGKLFVLQALPPSSSPAEATFQTSAGRPDLS